MRNFFFWVAGIVVFLLLIFFYWRYYSTYSDGYYEGLLQNFSRKGNVFKTYEGELMVKSAPENTRSILFSVINDSVAASLDTLQGRNVRLHYKEKRAAAVWRGDSPYIVDSVKILK